ncbi:hypothetical protein VPHD85_0055 [Vibrio phage D85]
MFPEGAKPATLITFNDLCFALFVGAYSERAANVDCHFKE